MLKSMGLLLGFSCTFDWTTASLCLFNFLIFLKNLQYFEFLVLKTEVAEDGGVTPLKHVYIPFKCFNIFPEGWTIAAFFISLKN